MPKTKKSHAFSETELKASLRETMSHATGKRVLNTTTVETAPRQTSNVRRVLAARAKIQGAFQSDAESLGWMLTKNPDLGGQTPLAAIFNGDVSAWEKKAGIAPRKYHAYTITASGLSRHAGRVIQECVRGSIFLVTRGRSGVTPAIVASPLTSVESISAAYSEYWSGVWAGKHRIPRADFSAPKSKAKKRVR